MSVENVTEWLKQMGYEKPVPTDFSKICNTQTFPIWLQLISHIKPRQEAERIKKNIVVNRLQNKEVKDEVKFKAPIKEIEIYKKKQKLEQCIKVLEKKVLDKEDEINNLLKINKLNYMKINAKQAKIRENRDKKFLLEKKITQIKNDIKNSKESLTMAKNLTPVEMEESQTSDKVIETLRKCAEKLEKLKNETDIPRTINKFKNTSSTLLMNMTKTFENKSNGKTLQELLNESKVITKITTAKKSSTRATVSHHNGVQKVLFSKSEASEIEVHCDKNKKPRESFGILSEDFLNTSDEKDNFLLGGSTILTPSLYNLEEMCVIEPRNNIIEKCYKNDNVKQVLKDLLYNNNRFFVITQWSNILDNLLQSVRVSLGNYKDISTPKGTLTQKEKSYLYFLHASNGLTEQKYKLMAEKAVEAVEKKKAELYRDLSQRSVNHEEISQTFEIQIQNVFYKGVIKYLTKKINNFRSVGTDSEIQSTIAKIKEITDDKLSKIENIQNLVSNIEKVICDIKKNTNESSIIVNKLEPLFYNVGYFQKLTEACHRKEIEVFQRFPLHFKKNIAVNESDDIFNNISDTVIPSDMPFQSNDLEMLIKIIDAPYSSPENIIFDAIRQTVTLRKFGDLKADKGSSAACNFHTYSSEDLAKSEEQLNPILDKLDLLLNSSEQRHVLESSNFFRGIDSWLEMPYVKYISESRQVSGHDFNYYEKCLEELKN